MAIEIRIADPAEPGCLALLEDSHALMRAMFPAESNHFLSVEALQGPEVVFLAAEEGGAILGCGALALKGNWAEVKSMFTAPEARGAGVAALILAQLEAEARTHGLAHLRLETGVTLDAARRLYARAGFEERGPFEGYEADPLSVFMEKRLG